MRERCDKECNGARLFGCRLVDARKIETRRRRDAHVATLLPYNADADRLHHLDEALHLLDARHALEGRRSLIEERRGEHRHGSVLGGIGLYSPAQLFPADYLVVHRGIMPHLGGACTEQTASWRRVEVRPERIELSASVLSGQRSTTELRAR